ncbi:putative UbiX-like flavin prenyltransferase [Alicyclobacillus hesperidum subsp. aegles]|uniref:UbiX family flavin prenyltransferase n=1 Tax=Alicyclobacillus hesperidum TaxID=89784 RepID=UPI00222C19B3|nr:UbiX family flavin prenyltransferase [Alicyclobacillus hesperidum]GLG00502.1 putative UbiX-like flavin prenyltransferase [Alicyclobacillus hesperidum subsp. aegles]
MRVIVGITGATGAIFGIRCLQMLGAAGVETHLIMSPWAASTISLETPYTPADVKEMATYVYSYKDQSAPIASGSYRVDGMIVAPCTVKTLAAIRVGLGENLLTRAADVVLKERRKLVLMVREMPLGTIHLENMLELSRIGAVIVPPMPAFYNQPETLADMVDHIVVRTLDQFDLDLAHDGRWQGMTVAKSARGNCRGVSGLPGISQRT